MEHKLKPTESELEILQVLWREGQATVRKVHETLSAFKDVGYTTTLKLMQIMHEKGLVSRDESGKTHIYEACMSQEKVQQDMVDKMVLTLFNGSASRLVMQALGSRQPNADEIAEIEALLKQYK